VAARPKAPLKLEAENELTVFRLFHFVMNLHAPAEPEIHRNPSLEVTNLYDNPVDSRRYNRISRSRIDSAAQSGE